MKINRRLISMAIISLCISAVSVTLLYKTIKQQVEPERTQEIAYFKNDVIAGERVSRRDIIFKHTPISLIPNESVIDFISISGKMYTSNLYAGDFALNKDFISRGETNIDVNDMFHIGIGIDSIENFLGTQLVEGHYYGLVFIDHEADSRNIHRVRVISLLDNTGAIVTDTKNKVIDSINVAIETQEEMRAIAEEKRRGVFELVYIPKDKWVEINSISSGGDN